MHTLWLLSGDQSLEILGFVLLLITCVIMVEQLWDLTSDLAPGINVWTVGRISNYKMPALQTEKRPESKLYVQMPKYCL